MIDLEKIKARRAAYPGPVEKPTIEQIAEFIVRAPTDIDALVAEVEVTRDALRELVNAMQVCSCSSAYTLRDLIAPTCMPCQLQPELGIAQNLLGLKSKDDLLPCGHPRSAIVTARDLGGPGTQSCGMCLAEEIDRAGGA